MRPRRGCKKPRLGTSSDEDGEAEGEKLKDLVQRLPCYQGEGSLAVKTKKSVEEDEGQLEEQQRQLVEDRKQLKEELERVENVKKKMEEDKVQLEQEKAKVEEERVKMEKMSKELQSQVECPVCLTLPREDKAVPCCPQGHIVCSTCRDKSIRQGRLDCPTCRVPMGQGQSLLALTVIKNVQHECGHQGCSVKFNLDQIKEHEETCVRRRIPCPGPGVNCAAVIPLCNVLNHVQGCPGCVWLGKVAVLETHIKVKNVGRWNELRYKTAVFEFEEGRLFFVKSTRKEGIYKVDVVMKGSQEDCEDFVAEASILNSETGKPVFKSSFQPRSLTDQNEAVFCLSVPVGALSKAWKYDENAREYLIDSSVKIVKS